MNKKVIIGIIVLLVLGAAAYYFKGKNTSSNPITSIKDAPSKSVITGSTEESVVPGVDKAIIEKYKQELKASGTPAAQ